MVYVSILSSIIFISPFSIKNILIHKSIDSSSLPLGPFLNSLLVVLKEVLYSISNSTIYTSLAHLNQNSITHIHFLFSLLIISTILVPNYSFLREAQCIDFQLSFYPLFNKLGNATKKISCLLG
jgi:hypothetical protein